MANPGHLDILKQGVEVWNAWRLKFPDIVPDLSYAHLNGRSLNHANFRKTNLANAVISGASLVDANFIRANLSNTDLRTARLYAANFFEANLTEANLTQANLGKASFDQSILNRANLTLAHLFRTEFFRVKLDEADLNLAVLVFTNFSDIDLSVVKGLDNVRHIGPSTIGIDTLYRSRGRISDIFLHGCGVPENLIIYSHSLIGQPIQFYSCFVSYSSKNQMFADRLYADLRNKDVRCWLASEDLKIGEKIRIGIDESIRIHDKLLLILSRYSVASSWVEQEVETALDRERKEKRTVLFPIRLDNTVMKIDTGWPALIKHSRNIGDFRKWKNPEAYQVAFHRLLRDLKAEEKKP
jgi:uncharacterized protein YjbI with pentapeptide repeats